eukprot:1113802-Pyramimonas_sp.AAC.1
MAPTHGVHAPTRSSTMRISPLESLTPARASGVRRVGRGGRKKCERPHASRPADPPSSYSDFGCTLTDDNHTSRHGYKKYICNHPLEREHET